MDREAEYERLVTELEEAGLAEPFIDERGREAIRLTTKGAQVGRALAMAGDDVDPEAMLAALLERH